MGAFSGLKKWLGITEPSPSEGEQNKSTYFPLRLDEVQPILDRLKIEDIDTYNSFMARIAKATKFVSSNPMQSIELFDDIIEDIKAIDSIDKRQAINDDMNMFLDSLETIFYSPKSSEIVDNTFIAEQNETVLVFLEDEEEILAAENEVLEKKPKHRFEIEEGQRKWEDALLEVDYRVAMLKIMNAMIHDYKVTDNPFVNYRGNELRYIEFIQRDLNILDERLRKIDNTPGFPLKKNPNLCVAQTYKKQLDSKMKLYNASGEDPANCTFGYNEQRPADCFFSLAKKVVRTTLLLNYLEYQATNDYYDDKVRQDAEKRLKGEDKWINKSAGIKKTDDERFNSMLRDGVEEGLITAENYLPCRHLPVYTARGAFSIMRNSDQLDEDAIVFSPVDEKSNTYRVIMHQVMCKDLATNLYNKVTKEGVYFHDYLGKMTDRDLKLFYSSLKDMKFSDHEIEETIFYKYDDVSGLYYLYRYRKETEEVKRKIELAYLSTSSLMNKRNEGEKYSRCLFTYFSLSSHEDMLGILRAINGANIRFFVDYDEGGNYPIHIYVDPSGAEKTVQILKKYNIEQTEMLLGGKVHDRGLFHHLNCTELQNEFVQKLSEDNMMTKEDKENLGMII